MRNEKLEMRNANEEMKNDSGEAQLQIENIQ